MLVTPHLHALHAARAACRAMLASPSRSLRTIAFMESIPALRPPHAALGARLPRPLAARPAGPPPPLPPARRAASGVACHSYASPEVYDIAFSFRDFESEVAFLLEAQANHGSGPLSRFLEVGCGPARHCALLAAAAGTACVGLDASQAMLDYAAQRAQREGVADRLAFFRADMAAPGAWGDIPGGQFDMAAVLLGTLSHCLDNGAALQCFRNLADAVRPGGLLVLELAHPQELFDGSFFDPSDFVHCWEASESGEAEFAERQEAPEFDPDAAPGSSDEEEEGEGAGDVQGNGSDGEGTEGSKLEGEKRVLVEYGREGDAFDPATQILRRTVGMSLFDAAGELVSSDVGVVAQRQFSLQEVDLMARATGWVTVAAAGNMVPGGVPLDDEDAFRMVVVLKRA